MPKRQHVSIHTCAFALSVVCCCSLTFATAVAGRVFAIAHPGRILSAVNMSTQALYAARISKGVSHHSVGIITDNEGQLEQSLETLNVTYIKRVAALAGHQYSHHLSASTAPARDLMI